MGDRSNTSAVTCHLYWFYTYGGYPISYIYTTKKANMIGNTARYVMVSTGNSKIATHMRNEVFISIGGNQHR